MFTPILQVCKTNTCACFSNLHYIVMYQVLEIHTYVHAYLRG